MTKEDLIHRLKWLRNEEEKAILLYTKHLETTLFLSTFPPETQTEIKEMLLTLAMESEVHARMFESTAKKIQESSQDVY